MEKVSGQILKAGDVKLEGQFRLDPGQTNSGMQNKTNTNSIPAKVQIVENNSEFALIEITCCCGTKTHIKCEYTDQNPAKQNNGENENENK